MDNYSFFLFFFACNLMHMMAILISHHHVLSAMALSHRTYPSFISAMSSTLGLSPKCVQLVMMWFRSHVAAPHIQFLLSL